MGFSLKHFCIWWSPHFKMLLRKEIPEAEQKQSLGTFKKKDLQHLKSLHLLHRTREGGKKDFHWAACTVCYSPGAGTRVCRGLLLPPRSSLCCVFAGPACQTPTECTEDGVSWCAFVYLLVLPPPPFFLYKSFIVMLSWQHEMRIVPWGNDGWR